MNNTELFGYSLQHPEPLVDDSYIKDRQLIISDAPNSPNQLMQINRELLDNITAYRVAVSQGNEEMRESILHTVQALLQNKILNFSEFASFWAVLDVSYSLYKSLPSDEQLKFLTSVIQKYLEMRHDTYTNHGYSATTLQVGKDAKAHKSSGSLGINKVAGILSENGYALLTDLTVEAFQNGDRLILFCDRNGKRLFREILQAFSISFRWSVERQGKMPDVLFKNGKHLFIVEHKHMKEGGGGQDKQVSEVIDFIGHAEEGLNVHVHYITFLDGLYFNLLTRGADGDGKIATQIATIRRNLSEHPDNYFVNTAGFQHLLSSIATNLSKEES